jgi:PAS domain S-box-containing protein
LCQVGHVDARLRCFHGHSPWYADASNLSLCQALLWVYATAGIDRRTEFSLAGSSSADDGLAPPPRDTSAGSASPRQNEALFRFLDDLTQATGESADADEILAITTKLTAQHLGLSNCAYADMDEDQDGFTIRGNWHGPDSPSIVGHYRLADFGTLAVQELGAGRPLIINDNLAEIAPEEAKTFQDIGIAATICMPLVKEGRLVALMAIHDRVPHRWSDYELTVIQEVTERSWAHVERVRSEAELRASNMRFQAAIRATRGVLWTNDAEGRMVGEQPGWQALTGQSYEEYQGYGWSKAVHPDDAQSTIEAWNEAVAGRKPFIFQHRVRRADGQWGTFSIRAEPILDDVGQVAEWVGVHTDITAERAAEHALREQSQTLQILNRTGAAIAAELDLERLVQSVTDAGVQITGAQFGAFFYNVLNEQGGSYMLYTLSGVDRSAFAGFPMPRATAVFGPTFAGEGVIRSPDITADPRYARNAPYSGMPDGHLPVRSYLAVPVASRSGDVIGGLFFGHSDPDIFSAQSEAVMVGLAAQAAIGIDNARLFQAVERARATLEQRVEERTAELEEVHDALRQSQKMEAIGQLTGGMAHDFNNLLTVIRGSADVLRRRDLTEEKRRRYVDAISDTADRAASLTGQLLAFARRQALKPEVFDTAARIQGIAEMLRSVLGARVLLTLEEECGDCYIEADVSQFETALVNLAVNARDAMDGEGELKIRISRVKARDGRDMVAVSTSDTGEGIPADEIGRIFEPFYTTKELGKGTGLGLSQVYGFVTQSKGEINVDSRVGEGATFTLLFPQADRLPIKGEAAASRGGRAEQAGKGTILIVEDNPQVGEFVEQMLADLEYETRLACRAEDALDILENEAAHFDLIFSDVVMPGMNGVEFGMIVRERWPELPVVLTSGYSNVLADDHSHGFILLHKPYSAEALTRTIREALEESA